MQKTGFGFFAPGAPPKRATPAVDSPLLLSDFVKAEHGDNDLPADPIGALIAKTQADAELAKNACTITDAQVRDLVFAPSDVRVPVPLSKGASPAADWSWSTPISALGKRATPARARLNVLLDRIFGDREDFRTEAAEIVDQALSDERAAILSEA